MSEKLKSAIKLYLDKVYGDLDCITSHYEVTWYRNGRPVASVNRNMRNRLRLSKSEFNSFRSIFCLPWENHEDTIPLLEMILPYLKFNGGSPAIPVLMDMDFIGEIDEIALPSKWD